MTATGTTSLSAVVTQPLTIDQITTGLAARRDALLSTIKAAQTIRDKANADIKASRSELADVDRLLAATKPRKRAAAS